GPDKMTPQEQLEAIKREFEQLMREAHDCLRQLFGELETNGIKVCNYDGLTPAQKEYANRYFQDVIFPVLTPLAVDPSRPFPHISNLSLNLSVMIRDREGEERFARLKVPDTLPQLVPLQRTARRNGRPLVFVWIEQVIQVNLESLFPGMEVLDSHPFHVT